MSRFITVTLAFLATLLLNGAAAQTPALTNADMVGTWQVYPDRFVVDGRLQPVPTNFTSFTMKLNVDGSFLATNAPQNIFSGSVHAEVHGKWSLSHSTTGDGEYYFFAKALRNEGFEGVILWRRSGLPLISSLEHFLFR